VPPERLALLIRKVQFTFPPGTHWRNLDVHESPFEASVVGGGEVQTDVRVRVSFRKAVPHPPVVIEHCVDLDGGEHLRSLDVTASAEKFRRLGLLPGAGEDDSSSDSEGGGGGGAPPVRGGDPAPGPAPDAAGPLAGAKRDSTGGDAAAAEGSTDSAGGAEAEAAAPPPPPSPKDEGSLHIGVRTNWEIGYESLTFASPKVRMGSGGYGEVFKAKWNGITVAVKELLDKNLSDDQIREFKQEVATLSHLRHPSIVLWMGCTLHPPNLAIVMEFCAGGSLGRLLHNTRASSPPAPSVRLKWAVSIAEGMKYLHSIDMIHRDLNSNNVLVDKRGQAKVCDFGLARVRMSTQCRTSRGRGTTFYTAPEVIRCQPHSESCDVFSFGVVLWELSVLQRPWEGYSDYQVMYQVSERGGRPEIPGTVHADLAELIAACWAEDPSARPDFDHILGELQALPPDAMLDKPGTRGPGASTG